MEIWQANNGIISKEFIRIETNYSDPDKKYNIVERDDSVLFLFCVLFLSLNVINTQGVKILQFWHGIKAAPPIKQIPGFNTMDSINPYKESPIILYNLKNSSANKIFDVKTNNISLTV